MSGKTTTILEIVQLDQLPDTTTVFADPARGRSMADRKTMKNTASVAGFVNAVADADRRRDCKAVMKMMKQATGKACLYINRLDDVDQDVLRSLIEQSVAHFATRLDNREPPP
jgi:hypothetical protein